jgi:hypothetical protein
VRQTGIPAGFQNGHAQGENDEARMLNNERESAGLFSCFGLRHSSFVLRHSPAAKRILHETTSSDQVRLLC